MALHIMLVNGADACPAASLRRLRVEAFTRCGQHSAYAPGHSFAAYERYQHLMCVCQYMVGILLLW